MVSKSVRTRFLVIGFSFFYLMPVQAVETQKSSLKSQSTLSSSSASKTLDLDPKAGEVDFKAIGKPSALKINGKGGAPHGEFSFSNHSASGSATFDLSTLKTGIDKRDHHMKEKYLEVAKYPNAKLTLTKVDLPDDFFKNKQISLHGVPFEGKLLLHGVEKPISGTLVVNGDTHTAKVDAQFGLKLTDFGISIPSFAGVTVADHVDVNVQTNGTFGGSKS